MDVFKIDRGVDNGTAPTYLPTDLLEGYFSMIWTERFRDPGEFELKVNQYISSWMYSYLPLGQFISHRDTDEVMQVETHSIDYDSDGKPELTITGRSLTMWPEQRLIEGVYQKKKQMQKNYTPLRAASVLLWDTFVNSSGTSVLDDQSGGRSTYDNLPQVAITSGVRGSSGVSKPRFLATGPMYPEVYKFLVNGDVGIRTMRPTGISGNVVSVTSDGTISFTSTPNMQKLRFEIYDGLDRTLSQSVLPAVVFSASLGHLIRPKYLFSIKDWKTQASVDSNVGGADSFRGGVGHVGYDERQIYVDAGSIEDSATSTELNNFIINLSDYGDTALHQHRKTRVVDTDISTDVPYAYKRDYWLGDLVTIYGDYSVEQDMLVMEHIRIEDKDGDRAYPTLVAIADD